MVEVRIAVGSDHAGYDLKVVLAEHLVAVGHEVTDLGTGNDRDSVDYPDFGAAVGRAVVAGQADLGVCVLRDRASASPSRPTRCPASGPPSSTT